MAEKCIFCKVALEEVGSKKIYENDNFFSILDLDQKIKGHSLVISKKHFKTVLDFPSTLGPELLDCVKKTALHLMEKEKCEGFNIINNSFHCAGQIIDHVHFHIFPRKKDDGIRVIY